MAQRQFRTDDTSLWNERFGDGSDGALTISADTTDAPIDSACSGTSGATSLTATNASFAANQIILIHQTRGTGAGNWELNKIQSYTAGTITTSYSLINTYGTGAQVLVLKQYSDVTVNSGKTLTAKAWNETVGGIVGLLCNGTITISGTVSASEKGYVYPTAVSNQSAGKYGEGTAGQAGIVSTSANGNGGGGGGYSSGVFAAGAGGGGNASAGTNGTGGSGVSGGTGGNSAGSANLTTMVFGGGGGGGAAGNNSTGGTNGRGSGLIFFAAKIINVTGSVVANGATGGNASGDNAGGGGGGAGGSIIFKFQTGSLGSNLVTASGGSGGSKVGLQGGNGGAASTGRIHVDYSVSLSGTTTPTLDYAIDSIYGDLISAKRYAYFM